MEVVLIINNNKKRGVTSPFLLFSILIFLLISGKLFSQDITLYDNSINKNFVGKVISINENKVKLKDTETDKFFEINIDKSNLKNIHIGDIVLVKKRDNFRSSSHYKFKCRNIRERIRQLAEKRRKVNRIHKGFSNHFMRHHGRK